MNCVRFELKDSEKIIINVDQVKLVHKQGDKITVVLGDGVGWETTGKDSEKIYETFLKALGGQDE